MKFSKYLLIVILFKFSSLIAQQKKPLLIVLPSDNWCMQRYFMTETSNQGSIQKNPNYSQAFLEDTELSQVISKISSLLIDRGFPLKDVEQELKYIETKTAEDNVTLSNDSGSSLAENQLNKIKNRVKADIIIQIWWKINKTENGKIISYTLDALDAYTSKKIASVTGNSEPNNKDIVPAILQTTINQNIDPFVAQLQLYFDDLVINGRETRITIKKWTNWKNNLETVINGEELIEHINNWMYENTVKGKFNKVDFNENEIKFEQVRIPLFNAQGQAIDASDFIRKLAKKLKLEPFNIDVKVMTRGLGEAILVLGEK